MEPLGVRPVLVEQAYRALLDAIADGSFQPGDRLTQEELADRLRVSRQPVSHALALLKQEGFVVEVGRRGLAVAPIDPDYVKALYEVRAALDGTAARLAAQRVQSADRDPRDPGLGEGLAELAASLEAGRRALAAGARPALLAADVDFHRTVNRLSGNPVIVETAERQWSHIRRAMGLVLQDPAQYQVVWQEHQAIAEALLAGDAALAEARAHAHATRAGAVTHRRLLEALNARPAA